MKLKTLLENMESGAEGTATILLLFDKLKKNAQFINAINELKMPTDKYKAILKFAELLGIPESKFADFTANMRQITNNKQPNNIDQDGE